MAGMTFRLLWLVALSTLPLFSQTAKLAPIPPVMACAELSAFSLDSAVGSKVQIRSAAEVTDGKPAPYCRVLGTIEPAIQFEVRLPATWTQRYLQTGCGGLCGNLNINAGRAEGCVPVTEGQIALASTDMGHSNAGGRGGITDPTWGVENPQTRIDFAYRGVHLTALAAKALIQKFYGQKARYSYFSGCSDGGREALMEAQRYPTDFDGIAAGAPAMNFITQNSFFHGWNAMVNTGADGQAILTADKLPILHKAILEKCDALDGVKDGLISNPPACNFDPAVAICKPGQDAATCLTPAQANTAKEIYAGAHDAQGHKFVISGPQPGSELAWAGVYIPQANTPIFSTGIALGTIKYLLYPKALASNFQLADFRFEQATLDAISPMHAIYDATDPDLSKFAAGGGKLLLYHGWSDPHISPLNSVSYYQAMQKTIGDAKVAQFSRMFLFPGGYHCNGGDGPFDFPLLSLIMNWVEGGAAPDVITATHAPGRGAAPDRTRPVYAWPAVAAYKGTGDINAPASFEKKPGTPIPAAKLQWQGSKFYVTPGTRKQ